NVIQVQRILRMNMATEHAIATVDTTILDNSLAVYFFRTGVNTNLHEFRFSSGILRRSDEGLCARRHGQIGRRRGLPRFAHFSRFVVKRIKNVALDTFGPTRQFEDLFRRADVNVEVDERATAYAAGLKHVDVFERAIIKQSEIFVVPKRARDLSGRARKIFFAPALT